MLRQEAIKGHLTIWDVAAETSKYLNTNEKKQDAMMNLINHEKTKIITIKKSPKHFKTICRKYQTERRVHESAKIHSNLTTK